MGFGRHCFGYTISEGREAMKKKRILYGILGIAVILIICGTFFLWYGKKGDAQPEEEGGKVSRQEWIKTLGEHSGATEGSDEEDYFSDVDAESEYYPYVQAAADWDFIDTDEEEFKGEENATGEFIAVTALKSIGEPKIQRYLGTEKALKKKDYVKLALDLKLVDKEQLKRGLSEDEVQDVIKKLDEHYYDTFWPKDLDEVEYQDNVRQLEEGTVTAFDEEMGILRTTEKLKEGDVITFRKDGFVVIRKVSSILEDGSYELGIPEMEEVFKTLKQSGVSELTFQDIVNYYGEENLVTAQAETSETNAAMMSAGAWNTWESEGGKIEVEEDKGKLKIFITQNSTGKKWKLPISPKISKDYEELSASLEFKNIFVASQIEYSWRDGVKYADVALDADLDVKNKIAKAESGDGDTERIILLETPAPIGAGVVGVDVQIYLVVTLSGEMYLEAEIPAEVSVTYMKGKGIRNLHGKFEPESLKAEANAELKQNLVTAPILVVGKFTAIIDADISVGVKTTATVTPHVSGQICSDILLAFPTVQISCGDEKTLFYGHPSLAAKHGLTFEWDIIDEENAPKKMQLHFEVLPDGKKQFVTKCTYAEEAGSEAVEEQDEEVMREFAKFAGRYQATEEANAAYGDGENLLDLEVMQDGSVSKGGTADSRPDFYRSDKPRSITKMEDGSYLCVFDAKSKYYLYPKGTAEVKLEDDEYWVNTVYIHFLQFDEETLDIIYVQKNITYLTKESSIPTMMFEYPDSWQIDSEEHESDYESVILKSERGVEINYYSSEMEFSQYYGGYHEVQYAHMTKAADASFQHPYQKESYVVAKIKVYAYDDGMTEDGAVEYDGPTYYAVVPERYLGDHDFCGTGYMGVCAFDCGRSIVMLATAPDGVFNEKEEEEAIQILASFKIED